MSERQALSVSLEGKAQVIEWDDGSTTRSWPVKCHQCGHETADYWEKQQDWRYLQEFEGDLWARLCSDECASRWEGWGD